MADSYRKPELSIAIPTCNGSWTISTALDSILPQLEEGVEIVISDNASTDNTAQIINLYQKTNPSIRYFRNDENVGFDRNVDLAVRRAKGTFVWLFADDDIMHIGGIKKVLDVIKEQSKMAEIYVDSLSPYTNLSEDCICRTGDEFFTQTAFRCGGLTSNVVNKQIWESLDLSPYFGTGWIHVIFLIVALSTNYAYLCKESFKSEILISHKRWGANGSRFYVGLNIVEAYQMMHLFGYSPETVRRAILNHKRGYIRIIPKAKAEGLKTNTVLLKRCINLYKKFPSFWLIDLPLLLVPGFCYKPVAFLYKKFFTPIIPGHVGVSVK